MKSRMDFGKTLSVSVAAWALCVLAATNGLAETLVWAQFRGPGGQGISTEKGLPTTWSAQENMVWKAELPGPGASSPIVVGGSVFVTCYSGYGVPGQPPATDMSQLKRHLLSLSLEDGKVVWQKDLPAVLPEQPTVRDHGYAASTPVSDGERLYVFFGKSGVFAFNLAGEQLWRADVGDTIHGWGSAASPLLYKDKVIINASVESQSLVALNKRTGAQVWRAKGIRDSWNTPCLVPVPGGKVELVVSVPGKVLGLDPDTGEALWNCAGVSTYICPSVVCHDGMVYAVLRSETRAIRAGGRGDVTGTHLLWTRDRAANVPSPVYHEGHLYLAREGEGRVYCLNGQTGEVVYEASLTPKPDRIYASPVLADGKLYYVSRGGRSYVLAAKPKFEQLACNDLGDRTIFDGSPVVAGGRLLLRSGRFLYCLGVK